MTSNLLDSAEKAIPTNKNWNIDQSNDNQGDDPNENDNASNGNASNDEASHSSQGSFSSSSSSISYSMSSSSSSSHSSSSSSSSLSPPTRFNSPRFSFSPFSMLRRRTFLRKREVAHTQRTLQTADKIRPTSYTTICSCQWWCRCFAASPSMMYASSSSSSRRRRQRQHHRQHQHPQHSSTRYSKYCRNKKKWTASSISTRILCFAIALNCLLFLYIALDQYSDDSIAWLQYPFVTTTITTNLHPQQQQQQQLYAKNVRSRIHHYNHQHNGTIGNVRHPNIYTNTTKKRRDIELLSNDCEYQSWQTTSFPTCNSLHELDFSQLIHFTSYNSQQPGYVASGYWRDVFVIADAAPSPAIHNKNNSNDNTVATVVLKMMTTQHDVTHRNWDRHRRDALTMERLTSHDNIIRPYAYCSNTLLTEHAIMGFDQYLLHHKLHIQHQQQQQPSTNVTQAFQQQVTLSLQAARSIAALHQMDIIHADLQTKQFLVKNTPHTDDTTLILNDFNRCRFLPRKIGSGNGNSNSTSDTTNATTLVATTTTTMTNRNNTANHNITSLSTVSQPNHPICPIHIPEAPGTSRSPEEYNGRPLDTAMDVYSLGNVLFQILVGERPFSNMSNGKIKKVVANGQIPTFPTSIWSNPWTAQLAVLIQMMFEKDTHTRLSAADLVRELELLYQRATKELLLELKHQE